mmetsp:Transcript_17952/g.30535  ORF Transcript_17952/g.30535 Transcript_17952/m.30535 type:complete len:188 (+) Transcript_17952:13-576(+)
MAENPKLFAALLNGVLRRVFENDQSITPEFLKEQIFAEEDVSVDEISQLSEVSAKVMAQAAYKNWDLSKLETLLKNSPFSEVQQEIFIRFWKLKKPDLHEKILNKCKWNDSLLQFSWRIDVKTKSRKFNSLTEPTAIIELNVGKHDIPSDDPRNNLFRFEMTKDQLSDTLKQIESIENTLASFNNQE